MKKIITAAVIASVALMSGCSQRVADLTVASTKNINLASNNFDYGPRVSGNDQTIAIIFPLGIPDVKTAADGAIEQDRCAVGLKDVVVDHTYFYLYFGFFRYDVTGNLIIDKSLPGCADWKYDASRYSPAHKSSVKKPMYVDKSSKIGSDLKV